MYKMWGKAMSLRVDLPPPEKYGWQLNNGTYCIDWECEQVQQKVKNAIDFLCRGCACKKGCKTKVVAVEGKRSRVGLVVNASNALMLLGKAQTLAC